MERLNLENEDLYKQKSKLNYHLRNTIKLELGIETIYQLTLQLILLLIAKSETRTSEAFDVVFKNDFSKWTIIVSLILSTSWSFISCSLAHIKGLMTNRNYFPIVSKIIAGLGAMISIIKRVSCIIIFFTPPLGLFNLLRHLQAEQTKFHRFTLDLVDSNGTIQFGNSQPIVWNTIYR